MNTIQLLNEPRLEFGLGKFMTDPRAGLTLFGPYDSQESSHPQSISYALIGIPDGIELFTLFVERIQKPVISCQFNEPGKESKDVRLWQPFPGFESAFQCLFSPKPACVETLNPEQISQFLKYGDSHKRVFNLVELYLNAIRRVAERDEGYRLVVCIEPDTIWKYCRPKSKVDDGIGTPLSKREQNIRKKQFDLFGTYDPDQYTFSLDFHRQLKARSMEYGIPIQLIQESTLSLKDRGEEERPKTPLSDRAWNLSTAYYYKAGGKPWRLATARKGVCYIGLVFKRTENDTKSRTACSAAQMFLDTGDGVVFRGEFGPWYSPETKEYHLDAENAENLLKGVLETYKEQGGQKLTEIFLHSRSSISEEEYNGYQRACPPGIKLVGIRVSKTRDELRIYRSGRWCILRGTLWTISDKAAYLWASGFKNDLLTYDGWDVPVPLRIDIQYGVADIEQVSKDILGLTKLNYNACKVGDSEPVTVGFSNKTGEILVSNPTITVRRPNFKFYI